MKDELRQKEYPVISRILPAVTTWITIMVYVIALGAVGSYEVGGDERILMTRLAVAGVLALVNMILKMINGRDE